MIKRFLSGLLAGAVALTATAAVTPLYENRGTVNTPQIDARVVVNAGTFNASTVNPYDTQNTLVFSNLANGLFQGSVGFKFDLATPTLRFPAERFVNRGRIVADEINFFGNFIGLAGNNFVFTTPLSFFLPTSFVLVNADDIVNSGLLSVGAGGLLQLTGAEINLTRGGLRSGEGPVALGGGRGSVFDTEYTPPPGVQELYAGIGVNSRLDPQAQNPPPLVLAQLQLPNPTSGSHQVINTIGLTNLVTVPSFGSFTGFAGFANTNAISETNWLVQVVFVSTNTPDTNFTVDVKFAPPVLPNPEPGSRIAIVQLASRSVDAVTGDQFTNFVYLLDSHATVTNATALTNLFNTNFFRPNILEITRETPFPEWAGAVPGNTPYTNTLILNPEYALTTVTNNYAAYGADVGILITGVTGGVSGGFGTPGGAFAGFFATARNTNPAFTDPTNLPGRIEILADQLDMSAMRLRSEGVTTIRAKHVKGNPPARVDAETLIYDLTSTNGNLVFSNHVQRTVERFDGRLAAWSSVWSNQTFMVVTNADTNQPPTTNTIDIRFHALIVDHAFQTVRPVTVKNLNLTSTNILIADEVNIDRTLRIQAESLTLTESFSLQGIEALASTNLINLLFLTNSGFISVPSYINLGADRAAPLSNAVNRGFMLSGGGIVIRSESIENTGQMQNFGEGQILLIAPDVKLDGGGLVSLGDVQMFANDLKVRNTAIQAGEISTNLFNGQRTIVPGAIVFAVTNRLSDNGGSSSNSFFTLDGFKMLVKPAVGDLLASSFVSVAPRFAEVRHVWAGEDRGAEVEGFFNNAAVGRLTLAGEFNTLFSFSGATANNAMYVDFLEFFATEPLSGTNQLQTFTNSLFIDTNMVVYFAGANFPAEELDGKIGGRLRWVRNFAGPNSSTNLVIGGFTNRVNRALVESPTIDSDGDGIPNRLDPNPFGGIVLSGVRMSADARAQVEISFMASPQVLYSVEFTRSLMTPQWLPLTSFLNTSPTNRKAIIQDPLGSQDRQRFYRVLYRP